MRLTNPAGLFSIAVIVSCSADHGVAPTTPPVAHASTSIILGALGTTALYQSSANAINDSGVVVGYAQATPLDRRRAAEWIPPDFHLLYLPDPGNGSVLATSIGNDG